MDGTHKSVFHNTPDPLLFSIPLLSIHSPPPSCVLPPSSPTFIHSFSNLPLFLLFRPSFIPSPSFTILPRFFPFLSLPFPFSSFPPFLFHYLPSPLFSIPLPCSSSNTLIFHFQLSRSLVIHPWRNHPHENTGVISNCWRGHHHHRKRAEHWLHHGHRYRWPKTRSDRRIRLNGRICRTLNV